MKYFWVLTTIVSLLFSLLGSSSAEQCGWQANNTLCPYEACCSSHGFCGNTPAYCGVGCQSQCNETQVPIPLQKPKFEKMLMHRNDNACPASGFYTYEAFITAAQEFPAFGTTGDLATREREIAAFFGQTSHETTGGWPDAPDGPYAWGYCFLKEVNPPSDYCSPTGCECAPGKTYIGRGPIQLSWNYNYCPCGEALNVDLENYPELVETDPVLAFKAAIWFWMTPQPPKPSCHDVITGSWIPPPEDIAANRTSGYGLITNIINGGIECGKGPNDAGENRIGFYKRYCTMIGVDPGDNLDCYYQRPYGSGLLLNTM